MKWFLQTKKNLKTYRSWNTIWFQKIINILLDVTPIWSFDQVNSKTLTYWWWCALPKYQFGCRILKMVGPKMQAFCPRIDMLKGNRWILKIRGASVCQKVPKLYFQSQFFMSKINRIFSKKKNIYKRISIYETNFLKKRFLAKKLAF